MVCTPVPAAAGENCPPVEIQLTHDADQSPPVSSATAVAGSWFKQYSGIKENALLVFGVTVNVAVPVARHVPSMVYVRSHVPVPAICVSNTPVSYTHLTLPTILLV